ncbi:MAG: SCO family protein [Planctomycetota bacterium]
MPRYIPIALWTLVALMGAGLLWSRFANSNDLEDQSIASEEDPTVTSTKDGRVFANIPWDHLPHVDRFVLTDQTGAEFDSADLHGQPYVVSFFFASCPSFCRDLNNELDRVNQILKGTDVRFLTITVEPEKDSIDVLRKYAAGYDAKPSRWAFLRGTQHQLARIGQRMFDVVVDRDTHTDNILLVDKWGRYRDRFKWDQPEDMKRFLQVARELAKEKSPPLHQTVTTRNVRAGVEPENLAQLPWMRDFHLKDTQGEPFFSRDLTGDVWLVHLSDQPTQENFDRFENLRAKLPELTLVNVTTNLPDSSQTSTGWKSYAPPLRKFGRIARECFGIDILRVTGEQVEADPTVMASLKSTVFIMDRWGFPRNQVEWTDENLTQVESEIQKLLKETTPPKPEFGFSRDEH